MPKRTAPRRKGPRRKRAKRFHKRRTLPRKVIKTSPGSSPNTHCFKRSYDHGFTVGVADNTNGLYMNSDNTWMIVRLHTKFNNLPDYDEFKALFSEYKITSLNHRLVPYFSQNQPFTVGVSPDFGIAIPNYEIFNLPVASSVREKTFDTMTGSEIDDFINQSQRKARRLMPSRTMNFRSTHPRVVNYKGPASKEAGTSLMTMGAPAWLNTDSSAVVVGGIDQTAVIHYSTVMLIRRVDGLSMNTTQPHNKYYQRMGFRMETEVFFKTRKVQ